MDVYRFYFGYTWGIYQLKLEGYARKANRASEQSWLQTRELIFLLYNTNVEAKNQKSRNELLPLPSDEQHYKPSQSRSQQNDRFFAALDREMERQGYDVPQDDSGFFEAIREHTARINTGE
ncbi:hypothetical protein FAES_3975 [Fibrella aestuarina BUZ 2]|uniref:Uncharacterized protein n=1 Tax=Fibrella aestuarina BUZ 2 TaxID=1166018 RepID=I0KCX3_9BACT|nr:hypothetical protein [Fibrella aestuarina]CCH01976.1 hypothetical protein FAES_3975 [Fibrella aestuarina BUZ 2]